MEKIVKVSLPYCKSAILLKPLKLFSDWYRQTFKHFKSDRNSPEVQFHLLAGLLIKQKLKYLIEELINKGYCNTKASETYFAALNFLLQYLFSFCD